LGVERSGAAGRAVFLSYASQDAEAAKRIADALRGAGVEVWFDAEGGLEHGDAWDAKIRRQIKECVLFIPLISANTQAREEGYFRIEWELAAQRALGIATGVAFILPVLIDGTKEAGALVPDRFRTVQWTKLPGGNVPPEVLQRFLKLWSHRTGALKGVAAEGGASLDDAQGTPRQQTPFRQWWMIFPVLGTVMGLMFAAVPLWKAFNRPARHDPARAEGPVAVPTKPVEPHTVKTVTPVTRDWPRNPELKKAMNLIEGLEAIPDDLALAEEIAKGVLDRSPTDIEAVTVMARVQAHFLRRGFDRSDERAALAKRYAERALQLSPDEPEAMYALATYHFSRATGETARTEQLLRQAIELDPTNPRPGRLLADLYNVTNRPAEAIAQGQDNIRRFPNDVLSHYDLARNYKDQGRYDEFDRELDATIALAPLPNAIVWKARLQFGLRNDFAGMKAWLDRVPPRVRGTERAVFSYFLYAGLGGDPEAGLAALRDFPEKWFTDFEYAGPTALLNASLLELQGKTELAQRQYEVAQGEILRMRQTDPGRIGLSQVEFWTLLGLGRTEEAKVSFRRVVEGTRRPYAQDMVNGWWFTVIPGSLLIGDRATALTLLRESVETRPQSRAAFRLRFEIDPRMAPFRDDPEIKALLADPGSVSAVSAPKIDSKSVAVLAVRQPLRRPGQRVSSRTALSRGTAQRARPQGAGPARVGDARRAFFVQGPAGRTDCARSARQLGVAYARSRAACARPATACAST
jgi:tetratricopeptide (TPR) repeat protein